MGLAAAASWSAAVPRSAAATGPDPRARSRRDTPAGTDGKEDDDVYAELATRWTAVLVGDGVPAGNPDYAAAVAAQDAAARRHLASLRADGPGSPWADLPVDSATGASANVTAAAGRLLAVATGYATPASALHGDADAAAKAAAGIRTLCAAAYHPAAPGTPARGEFGNWWDWEIGTPKALGDACVLLGAALPGDIRTAVTAAVDHFVPDPRRMLKDTLDSTGANRVDLCRTVAVRGVLGRSAQRLTLASDALRGVLDPVPIGDGLHADHSFLMHTWVPYPGTYGEVLLHGMAELMRLLAGTEWDVAAEERRRTTEAVTAVLAPFLPGGIMDDTVRGRALARTAERDADDGFLVACDTALLAGALDAADPAAARRLRATAKGWLRANTFRPLADRPTARIATALPLLADASVPAAPDVPGLSAFPDMERLAHRRPGWQATLALNSDRIARFEYMNGENAHGWHTGDGMLTVRTPDDRFHYTDAYWPTVDARRLPGSTVDTAPLADGAGGRNEQDGLTGTRWSGFAAEVNEADEGEEADEADEAGRTGRTVPAAVAGLELTGWDSTLTGRLTWLFLPDGVVAAGSGITATGGRRVETVVDNRNLGGPPEPSEADPSSADPPGADPSSAPSAGHPPAPGRPSGPGFGTLTVDGRRQPDAPGTATTHARPRWAHLAGTGGYVFLDLPRPAAPDAPPPTAGPARRAARPGPALHTLREDRTGRWSDLATGGPTAPVTRRYVTLWHDHGVDPAAAAHAHLLLPTATARTTAHRADAPGVRVAALTRDVHAFHAGELTAAVFFAAGAAAGIRADGPCAVLLRRPRNGPLSVAVSDPSRTVPVVRLTVDTAAPLVPVRADDGITVLSSRAGTLRLAAATGGRHGATLTAAFRPGTPAAPRTAALLPPVADATVRGGTHAGESDGRGAVLAVREASTADGTARAYLAFDLRRAARGGRVRHARLWLHGRMPLDPAVTANYLAAQRVAVHGTAPPDPGGRPPRPGPGPGPGWSETGLTWSNAPALGDRIATATATVYPDWLALDVTGAVRAAHGRHLTLAVTVAGQGAGAEFTSREGERGRGPVLDVLT